MKDAANNLEKIWRKQEIPNSSITARTAPSKRIIKAIEGDKKRHYNYNKPVTGKEVTKSVGIDGLRTQCKHFDEWNKKADKLLIYCLYLRIKVKPALYNIDSGVPISYFYNLFLSLCKRIHVSYRGLFYKEDFFLLLAIVVTFIGEFLKK